MEEKPVNWLMESPYMRETGSTTRLFPMSRPATREAIGALRGPRWCRRACRTAPIWRRRCARRARCCAASRRTFAPRTLLLVLTDGALRAAQDGAALDRALGAVPELELSRGGVRRAPARRRSGQPRGAAGAERLRGEPARHRARAARRRGRRGGDRARWPTSTGAATSRAVRAKVDGRQYTLAAVAGARRGRRPA